jgi:hypothetical protein
MHRRSWLLGSLCSTDLLKGFRRGGGRRHHDGRRSRIETLEVRDYMSANTIVGDASFVLYDGKETATVDTEFSRPVATVDAEGNPIAADDQRYGDSATYAPPVQWQDSGVSPPAAEYAKVLASGWDSDGVTPLMLYMNETGNRLLFYRGDNLTLVRNQYYYRYDIMNGTVAGEIFVPKAAIIHHGLIVIGTTRWRLMDDGKWKAVGVEFFTSQNYGATFQRVPVVGGGYGLPIFEPAIGDDRLHTWSFENAFPVNGIDDKNAVWFPWTDYIYKTGYPKGGQVGLFRADRAPGETQWTISPNRIVYDQWITEDNGGVHAHTAAITNGGIISHWGDVSYRNHTLFHQFDLSDYQTAPVVTVNAFGAYTAGVPGTEHGAPQPVAAAPSPIPGAHLAGGDETPDHILSFGPMTSTADRLNVTTKVYKPEGPAPGAVHGGAAVLHLQWLQGVGYAAAAVNDDYYYYSPDGEHWARVTLPTASPNSVWLYGNRLLTVAGGKFWLAPLPAVDSVKPVSISPGATNLVDTTLGMKAAPGAGNTSRRVVYQEGAWRYADTLIALEIQTEAPPFLSDAPVYEITMGDQDNNLGTWWLQPPGTTSSTSLPHVSDIWIANLASQELRIGAQHLVGNSTGSLRYYQINDNTQWTATGVSFDQSAGTQGRYAVALKTIYRNPGAKFLIAVPYFGESAAATYPMAPQTASPDEVVTANLGTLTSTWSAGFVARWPENARPQGNSVTPIASLTGSTGDAVVWSVYQREVGTKVSLEFYRAGVLVTKQDCDTRLLRGDVFETLVSSSGENLIFTFRVAGQSALTFQFAGMAGLQLDKFQWAGRDGDVVMGIDPMLLVIDKDKGWTAAEHTQWIGSSLEQKAVFNAKPAAGDFNFDGVVDQGDLAVWEATRDLATPGCPGDANGNGYVDQGDIEIWRQQYGMSGEGIAADFNADGFVDAADYTVWRDAIQQPNVTPGSGADANHDGFIRTDDLDYWFANLGTSYSSLQQLRAASNPQPAAISAPSVTLEVPPVTALSLSAPPTATESPAPVIENGSAQRIAMLTYDAAFAATASQITTASKLRGGRQVWAPGRCASLDAAFAAR